MIDKHDAAIISTLLVNRDKAIKAIQQLQAVLATAPQNDGSIIHATITALKREEGALHHFNSRLASEFGILV